MKKMKRMKVMMTAGAMLFAGSIGILPESVTEQFAIAAGAEESIVASGECGYDLTWTLDSEGTLTISGEGEMKGYDPPWKDYENDIKSVVIEEGVTNIPEGVFDFYENITSATIPASVTRIEDVAFNGCSSLTAFHVDAENAEYTSVDGVLFSKDKTELIDYPDNKEETEYVLPDSVTSIKSSAFFACMNLTAINVNAENTEFSSIDGVLFNKEKTTLIRYPVNKPETEYVVPDGVEMIDYCAFSECENLTTLTLPDSVAWLNFCAFSDFYGLTSIEIPEGVPYIRDNTFYNCKNLTTVTIPESVTSIGCSAFKGCKSLTSINIPDAVTSIGYHAFYNCESITSINIPDAVTSIGHNAFYNCKSLTSITLPEGITKIEYETFSKCESLASVTLPATVTSIERYAFNGCESLTSITIPEGVTTIGSSAFSLCKNLTSITLPEGLTEINYDAFGNCHNLTDVTIPKSVTEINDVFYSCYRLENVYYAGTEEEWNAIRINDEYLLKAKIHFGGTTPPVMGDIDSDDKFGVTDIIFVQKLLFGQETLTNWQAADLNEDDRVDGFDLAIMKRLLLKSNRAESNQAS